MQSGVQLSPPRVCCFCKDHLTKRCMTLLNKRTGAGLRLTRAGSSTIASCMAQSSMNASGCCSCSRARTLGVISCQSLEFPSATVHASFNSPCKCRQCAAPSSMRLQAPVPPVAQAAPILPGAANSVPRTSRNSAASEYKACTDALQIHRAQAEKWEE